MVSQVDIAELLREQATAEGMATPQSEDSPVKAAELQRLRARLTGSYSKDLVGFPSSSHLSPSVGPKSGKSAVQLAYAGPGYKVAELESGSNCQYFVVNGRH